MFHCCCRFFHFIIRSLCSVQSCPVQHSILLYSFLINCRAAPLLLPGRPSSLAVVRPARLLCATCDLINLPPVFQFLQRCATSSRFLFLFLFCSLACLLALVCFVSASPTVGKHRIFRFDIHFGPSHTFAPIDAAEIGKKCAEAAAHVQKLRS